MLIIQKAALTIDDEGLHYGPLKLAHVRGGVLTARPAACRRLVRPEQAAAVDKAIAAWNRGDKTRALIKLVHLGAPQLGPPSPGWLRHLELVRLEKAGFDPSQPRDDQGMWTSEGGSAARQPVIVTPLGDAGADTGVVDDGVYHTTLGDDGKPVLPQATLAQFVPEEPTEGSNEEAENSRPRQSLDDLSTEELAQILNFRQAENTLREIDPQNPALQSLTRPGLEYIPTDEHIEALQTAAQEASIKRSLDFLQPSGEPIGEKGGNEDVREMPGRLADAKATFNYLSVGGINVTPTGYNGILMRLPGNAGFVGFRPVFTSGPPTVDVKIPGSIFNRIHYIGQ